MKLITFNILSLITLIITIILFWNKIGWLRFTVIWFGLGIILAANIVKGVLEQEKKKNKEKQK